MRIEVVQSLSVLYSPLPLDRPLAEEIMRIVWIGEGQPPDADEVHMPESHLRLGHMTQVFLHDQEYPVPP